MLLYFKGIAKDFHDIDVMVTDEDADAAKEIFLIHNNKQELSGIGQLHFWI